MRTEQALAILALVAASSAVPLPHGPGGDDEPAAPASPSDAPTPTETDALSPFGGLGGLGSGSGGLPSLPSGIFPPMPSGGLSGGLGGGFPLPTGGAGLGGLLGGLGGSAGSGGLPSSMPSGGLEGLLGGLGGSGGASGLGGLLAGLGGGASGSGGLPFPMPSGGLGGASGSGGLPDLGSLLGGGASGGSNPLAGLMSGMGGASGSNPLSGLLGGLGGSSSSGSEASSSPDASSALPSDASVKAAAPSPASGGNALGGLLGGLTGGSGTTSNDLSSGACKKVTLIYARGTTEPGNMGLTVGPSLAGQLKQKVGANDVAVQGVDYPADVAGTVVGSVSPGQAEGAQKMSSLAKQTLSKCPSSKIVLAGYSQGAQQVHGALMNLGADAGKVAAAITFGDPLKSQAFKGIPAAKTKVFCAQGDGVCGGAFAISAAHLSYTGGDTASAAQFIASQLGQ